MTNPEIQRLIIMLGKIGMFTILLPIVVAIWQRKQLNLPLRIFLWYRTCAIFINLLGQIFIWFAINDYEKIRKYVEDWGIQNTSFLTILYYASDFIFLGWFFYLLLGRNPYGIWVWRIATLLLIANIVNYCFIEGYKEFGFFNPTSDAIFIFGVAAFYLWHLYKSQLTLPLTKNPYFWICLGLILPHLIGFFLFLVGDVAQKENFPFFVALSIAKNCFLIIAQVFYAIGFWRARYAKYLPLPWEKEAVV